MLNWEPRYSANGKVLRYYAANTHGRSSQGWAIYEIGGMAEIYTDDGNGNGDFITSRESIGECQTICEKLNREISLKK